MSSSHTNPSADFSSTAHTAEAGGFATVLGEIKGAKSPDAKPEDFESQLINARLGIASGLFIALRAKHPMTASHCLRVALGCSSWAEQLSMDDHHRDEVEIAALLHDIGKLGVPDHVLTKPSRLDANEVLEMEKHRQYAREILSPFCSPEILDIVYYSQAWYDGRRHGYDLKEKRIPLGARVLAIVDAFDAMTSDHVYRRAMSRDRALAELFQNSGTQFDTELVKEFYSLLTNDRVNMGASVARRWLQQLHPESSNQWWQLEQQIVKTTMPTINDVFHQKLFDSMHDGVIFVDTQMRILLWNRATERLTGISTSGVQMQQWEPSLVSLCDEQGKPISTADCPVAYAIKSGVQTLRRLSIVERNGNNLPINAHMVPVIGRDGVSHGAALLLHDASSQTNLEERVETLHKKATFDSLTQVANRAEFDRQLKKFTSTQLVQGVPFSLIICDIDHFKKINDNFGHQAGDDTLVKFAATLRKHCRSGDLVARYGGEEFVILCGDCDNASATAKAEAIRRELSESAQPQLGGRTITASFGVTEVQEGDTCETMLRRADRALYEAKETGRNRVIQLGAGIRGGGEKKDAGWFSWLKRAATDEVIHRRLITAVPLSVAAQKLRGFVSDHEATIQSIQDNRVLMKIDADASAKRQADRPVPFFIELKFAESTVACSGRKSGTAVRTLVDLMIRPKKNRDRRRRDVAERANQLVSSLRSYLMAEDYDEDAYETVAGADGETQVGEALSSLNA